MMTLQEAMALDQAYVAHTYGRAPFLPSHGRGATCWDTEGRQYIDFSSGIGVTSLGFADPEWVAAVSKQAGEYAHICNYYYSAPGEEAAKLLCEKSGMKKVLFANSGAEANEGMIKTARKYSQEKYGPARSEIVTLVNSFHGRTVTTLTATGQEAMHQFFYPFTPGFSYAEANNFDDLLSKVSGNTAGIMVELIQGEGGVVPLDAEFVQKVAALCRERDILLLVDEVQTGNGRTGYFYSYQAFGIEPDLVSTAKGLGNGLPIGAVLFGEKTEHTLKPGDHGTTFGMNPIVCAGAKVVLERIDDAFLKEVTRKGELIRQELAGAPNVASVTGMGLMIGVLPERGDAHAIFDCCRDKGLLVLTAKNKIRLLPPLVITDGELMQGLGILKEALKEAQAS